MTLNQMNTNAPSRSDSGDVAGEVAGTGSSIDEDLRSWTEAGTIGLEPSSKVFEASGTGNADFCNLFGTEQSFDLEELAAESVEGSDVQQYECPGDVLSGHDVNVAEDPLRSGPKLESFDNTDIDACIDSAFLSIPLQVPKPIWEEGVWDAIFNTGILMNVSDLAVECRRPSVFPTLDVWLNQMVDSSLSLKRKAEAVVCESYADVVRHLPIRDWQEERESMLQAALKRWMVTVTAFSEQSTSWQQLASEGTDVRKLSVLADVFAGKAPATLLKRVRAVEKMVQFLGVGTFPTSEPSMYRFFQAERDAGAPASRLKSYMEALAFCLYTFSMSELRESVQSKRLHGATVAAVPTALVQSEPLTVAELLKLHEILNASLSWDAMFSGAVLFSVYSRSRWGDAMHCCKLTLDKDDACVTQFLEGETAVHKSMHAEIYKHRFLPMVAPTLGVAELPWADRWMQVRAELGVKPPPEHPLMPAPAADGAPQIRPLSATEAGDWLRKLLTGSKGHAAGRRITAHSMKSTCLSFCAKFGLSAEVRLQLGYHVAGFKMLHTYSRDAAAQPLLELARVLRAVRMGTFKPDVTRSGRFIEAKDSNSDGRAVAVEVIDLEPKEESHEIASEVIPSSSSSSSSEEEFQKSNSRVFLPPVPPEGYVFWQHRKLRTLHLAMPEARRVLMCNRYMNERRINEGMVIRYDTPVCRQCAAATRV